MLRRDWMTLALRAAAAAGGQEFFSEWLRAVEKTHAGHASLAPPEPDRWTNYVPKFFPAAEFSMLQSFTGILIPTDETPGASEAHVAHFIDFVVNASAEYAPQTQQDWRNAMSWLSSRNFGQLPPRQQLSLMEQMAAPERDPSLQHDGFRAYKLIKQAAVFAFYTSRAGLIDNLKYKGNAYLTVFPACDHPEHRNNGTI